MSAILTDEQFAWIAARDAELARLRTRCDELNEACSAKQALLDLVAADERDFMELVEGYKRERDAALAEVERLRAALRTILDAHGHSLLMGPVVCDCDICEHCRALAQRGEG